VQDWVWEKEAADYDRFFGFPGMGGQEGRLRGGDMKTGFIGGGKMADAMMGALLESKTLATHEISASDIDAERRRYLKRRHGINIYSRNSPLVGAVETVILAVKPQNLDDVLEEISRDITSGHLVVSIAAGKRLRSIESKFGVVRAIRVMPNLPCVVAEGMSVFCMGKRATMSARCQIA
jgi:pyrroline-5-carboxylate reductase